MKVRDYVHDMTIGTKWAVQVETTLTHDTEEQFEEVGVETYHYSVPVLRRCPYYDDTVEYCSLIDNEIVLFVRRNQFV